MAKLRGADPDSGAARKSGVGGEARRVGPTNAARSLGRLRAGLVRLAEVFPMTKARTARQKRLVRSTKILTREQQDELLRRAKTDPKLRRASADMLSAHPEFRRKGPHGGELSGPSRR